MAVSAAVGLGKAPANALTPRLWMSSLDGAGSGCLVLLLAFLGLEIQTSLLPPLKIFLLFLTMFCVCGGVVYVFKCRRWWTEALDPVELEL